MLYQDTEGQAKLSNASSGQYARKAFKSFIALQRISNVFKYLSLLLSALYGHVNKNWNKIYMYNKCKNGGKKKKKG